MSLFQLALLHGDSSVCRFAQDALFDRQVLRIVASFLTPMNLLHVPSLSPHHYPWHKIMDVFENRVYLVDGQNTIRVFSLDLNPILSFSPGATSDILSLHIDPHHRNIVVMHFRSQRRLHTYSLLGEYQRCLDDKERLTMVLAQTRCVPCADATILFGAITVVCFFHQKWSSADAIQWPQTDKYIEEIWAHPSQPQAIVSYLHQCRRTVAIHALNGEMLSQFTMPLYQEGSRVTLEKRRATLWIYFPQEKKVDTFSLAGEYLQSFPLALSHQKSCHYFHTYANSAEPTIHLFLGSSTLNHPNHLVCCSRSHSS